MTDAEADHDAEIDAIVAELEAAGLLTVEFRADGLIWYALTQEGEHVARRVTIDPEDDAAVLLGLLLGRRGPAVQTATCRREGCTEVAWNRVARREWDRWGAGYRRGQPFVDYLDFCDEHAPPDAYSTRELGVLEVSIPTSPDILTKYAQPPIDRDEALRLIVAGWGVALDVVPPHERLDILVDVWGGHGIDHEELRRVLPAAWAEGYPDDTDRNFLALWGAVARGGTLEAEAPFLPLGDHLTVYRPQAVFGAVPDGIAWALDARQAMDVAARRFASGGVLVEASVDRYAVLGFVTGHRGTEVVVDPVDVKVQDFGRLGDAGAARIPRRYFDRWG